MVGLIASYFLPFALELKLPAAERTVALEQFDLPLFHFPAIKVPEGATTATRPRQRTTLPAQRAASQRQAAAPQQRRAARSPGGTRTIPVVTSTYTLVPQPKQSSGDGAKDPFAKAPVVDNSIGGVAPPADPTATQQTDAPAAQAPTQPAQAPAPAPAPAAESAPPPAETTPPPAETPPAPVRTLQAVTNDAPAETAPAEPAPAPAPAPEAAPSEPAPADTAPATISSTDTAASDTAETTTAPAPVETITSASTTTPTTTTTVTTVTVTTTVAAPAPPVVVAPVEIDFESVAVDTQATRLVTITNPGDVDLVITEFRVESDADGSFAVLTGGPLTVAPGATVSVAVAFAPKKVGAVAARLVAKTDSPSGEMVVQLAGNGTFWQVAGGVAARGPPEQALDATIRVTTETIELIDADGVVDTLTLSGVSSVTISGSAADDRVTIELDGESAVSVLFDGGDGTDTFVGPGGNRTWAVDGPGAGSVGGVSFTGVEALEGAAGNEDTFVFGDAGTVPNVEGGDGGYDTVVLGGSTAGDFAATITGPQSGTLTRGGATIAYSGFEPITVAAGCTFCVLTVTGNDANTINVRTHTDGTSIMVEVSGGETHVFSNVASMTGLTINAGAGNDQITVNALPAAFAGDLTINGQADLDTGIFLGISTNAASDFLFDGGDGADSLLAPNNDLTWTLSGDQAGTVGHIDFVDTETLSGGTGVDTLVGPNEINVWTVTGANAGTLDPAPHEAVSFRGMEHIRGGSQADGFTMGAGTSISGSIAGGAGIDTLTASHAANTWAITGAGFAAIGSAERGSTG